MAMASTYSSTLTKSNQSARRRKVPSNSMRLGGKEAESKEGPVSLTKCSRFFSRTQCCSQTDLRSWWSKRWASNCKAADSTTCMWMTSRCCRIITVRPTWFLRSASQQWQSTRTKCGSFNLATWKVTSWQVHARTIRYAFGSWSGSRTEAFSRWRSNVNYRLIQSWARSKP